MQNATIPCHCQELLLFLSVMYFFLPPFSTNYSSILSHLILPLFLGLPLNLVVPKFIYNVLLGILFPSILCKCTNQRNLFNLIVSLTVGLLTLAQISLLVKILQLSFSLSCTVLKLFYTLSFQNCSIALCLSLINNNTWCEGLLEKLIFRLVIL